jgi:hypothetical protein
MPARLIAYYINDNKDNIEKMLEIINNRNSDKLFIASVKGPIRATDEERINGITIEGKHYVIKILMNII